MLANATFTVQIIYWHCNDFTSCHLLRCLRPAFLKLRLPQYLYIIEVTSDLTLYLLDENFIVSLRKREYLICENNQCLTNKSIKQQRRLCKRV